MKKYCKFFGMKVSPLSFVFYFCIFSCANKIHTQVVNVECEKCDLSILVLAQEKSEFDRLFVEEVMCSIDSTCANNIEFSQFSNEIVYKLLSQSTSDFVEIYSTLKESHQNYLIEEISNPISDIFNLEGIIFSLEKVAQKEKLELLEAVRLAKSKY